MCFIASENWISLAINSSYIISNNNKVLTSLLEGLFILFKLYNDSLYQAVFIFTGFFNIDYITVSSLIRDLSTVDRQI